MKNLVVVVNPGTHPEPGWIAYGLAKAGMTVEYLTSLSFSPRVESPRPLARLIPYPGLYVRARRSRTLPFAHDRLRVRRFGMIAELLRLALRRAPIAIHDFVMHSRSAWVDVRAARLIRAQAPGYVVIQYGVARRSLDAARDVGALVVLNYSTTHHRELHRILAKAAVDRPEWAFALTELRASRAHLEELDYEVAAADVIIVGGEHVRQSFLRDGLSDERVHAIPYGIREVPVRKFDVERPSPRVKVLFVGQLSQRKGVGDLVDAFLGSPLLMERAELILAGPAVNGSDAHIRRRAEGKPIHLEGTVSKPRVDELLLDADIFALPSYVEGSSLAAAEAARSGLPLIVSSIVLGDPSVARSAGAVEVDAGDLSSLQQALEALCLDDGRRQALGRAAQQWSTGARWELFAERAAEVVLAARGS